MRNQCISSVLSNVLVALETLIIFYRCKETSAGFTR